jgi:3-oxoacyl-[acyl-carrier protein] reductase
MHFGITEKRALVTGAGRGLGRSIALALAREGAKVAIVSRSVPDLTSLLEDMGGVAAGHYSLPADLMPDDAPTRLLQDLSRHFGPLDIAVHNLGGTLNVREPLCTVMDWRRLWRLNLEIAIEMNRIIVPDMQARGWGRVVHISSIAPVRGRSSIPYTTVKGAVNAYVRGLGCAVAKSGVVVTAVMPGSIRTEGGHWDIAMQQNPDQVKQYAAESIATGRFGKPEEVSDFVAFLCSERASFFAGSVIPVDGGTW